MQSDLHDVLTAALRPLARAIHRPIPRGTSFRTWYRAGAMSRVPGFFAPLAPPLDPGNLQPLDRAAHNYKQSLPQAEIAAVLDPVYPDILAGRGPILIQQLSRVMARIVHEIDSMVIPPHPIFLMGNVPNGRIQTASQPRQIMIREFASDVMVLLMTVRALIHDAQAQVANDGNNRRHPRDDDQPGPQPRREADIETDDEDEEEDDDKDKDSEQEMPMFRPGVDDKDIDDEKPEEEEQQQDKEAQAAGEAVGRQTVPVAEDVKLRALKTLMGVLAELMTVQQ